MDELKPCPFCGGEASKRLFYKGKYRVHCNGCDAHSGDVYDTEAEAIAAWNTRAATTIGKVQVEIEPVLQGTLTAEQVREAIFNGSSYASYDGAKYYADGIGMQSIADELNAMLGGEERTCRDVSVDSSKQFYCSECECTVDVPILWGAVNYCPNCGARVIE